MNCSIDCWICSGLGGCCDIKSLSILPALSLPPAPLGRFIPERRELSMSSELLPASSSPSPPRGMVVHNDDDDDDDKNVVVPNLRRIGRARLALR